MQGLDRGYQFPDVFKALGRRILTAVAIMASLTNITSASGNDNPTLSYNLGSFADYQLGMQFLDIAKMMRPWVGNVPGSWGSMSYQQLREGGYLDDEGWVKKIPEGIDNVSGVWQWGSNPEFAEHRKGVYVLEYEGEGYINISGDVRIISKEQGQIVFENLNGGHIYLGLRDIDPKGTGDYIRDITIVPEKHKELYDLGGRFNPDWLELIDDARELRFMDWNSTNNSTITSWDERGTPEGLFSGRGVAVELMVQLANEVGADPWFTMPHLADEDYIREFATYVRDNLDPNLKVRVEYTNEAWNWAFEQTRWLAKQSKSEWGQETPYDYYAKKAVEVALIWEDVFGDQADARLINVLGAQAANVGVATRLLEAPLWRENEPDTYVAPASVFEEVAIATYFGSASVADKTLRAELIAAIKDPGIDATEFLAEKLMDPGYSESIPWVLNTWQANADVAHKYGLKLTAYEGGQHVHHSFGVAGLDPADVDLLTDFMIDFVRSEEMAALYQAAWDGWMAIGDGPFMQFSDILVPSKWGSWGVRSSLDDENNISRLLDKLNASETPAWDGAKGGDHYTQGAIKVGTSGNDVIEGTTQEDYLIGKAGNDTFVPGPGNDGIHGGAGHDRVILSGNTAKYTLRIEGDGYRVTGPDGSNFLISIEELEFTSGQVVTLNELIKRDDGVLELPDVGEVKEGQLLESGSYRKVATAGLGEATEGLLIQAINPDSDLGKELVLDKTDKNPSYVVVGKGDETFAKEVATYDGAEDRSPPPSLEPALEIGAIVTSSRKIIGTVGNDIFFGSGSDDRFAGGEGKDRLFGRGGDDVIRGNVDNDVIYGNRGKDTMSGGKGDDALNGGRGADRFQFWSGDGHDTILDFSINDRVILKDYFSEGQTLENSVSMQDGNLVISNSLDSITLVGLEIADLEWASITLS